MEVLLQVVFGLGAMAGFVAGFAGQPIGFLAALLALNGAVLNFIWQEVRLARESIERDEYRREQRAGGAAAGEPRAGRPEPPPLPRVAGQIVRSALSGDKPDKPPVRHQSPPNLR